MNVYVQVKWDRRLGIPWQSTCALTLANALKFLPLRTQGKVVHQELAVPCGIHSRTALRGLRVWNYFRKACLTSLGMTAFQELVFLKGMRMNWCTFAFFRVIFKFFFTRYVWDAYIHRMGWQISPIYGSCCVCLGGVRVHDIHVFYMFGFFPCISDLPHLGACKCTYTVCI